MSIGYWNSPTLSMMRANCQAKMSIGCFDNTTLSMMRANDQATTSIGSNNISVLSMYRANCLAVASSSTETNPMFFRHSYEFSRARLPCFCVRVFVYTLILFLCLDFYTTFFYMTNKQTNKQCHKRAIRVQHLGALCKFIRDDAGNVNALFLAVHAMPVTTAYVVHITMHLYT